MKKSLLTALILILVTCMLLTSCGDEENNSSNVPSINISDDGFWIINGIKTAYTAVGTDGVNG